MPKTITDTPPILPDVAEQLRQYLVCPDNLPIYEYERCQEFWPRKPDPASLFYYDNAPLSTTLKVQRDPNSGEIIEFREVPLQHAGATAKNSMSYSRAPVPLSESTRGNASYFPFWPGGFPDPIAELPKLTEPLDKDVLLTIAPGFKRGLVFGKDGVTVITDSDEILPTQKIPKSTNVVNLIDIVHQEPDLIGIWETPEKTSVDNASEVELNVTLPEEEEILPPGEVPVLNISQVPSSIQTAKSTEWAVLLDTSKPVVDFQEKVPEVAHDFPFELDTFQKQAIVQLEQHNHVFVAAHTSAGKTVVAEYAIALSQKHMTRTIYTSPIKALSNQKYRDFKRVFKDVGLVTGDFQINQTAACLIMTTEILRSMLYCGSDVTRDLEFVIFDEVHYVNDKERGHVWEQVLIMLPSTVCVVLLSATVPNAIEFADWLGYTYQKKVYVITTSKRPVPLQHYLYTGCGGGSRHNRYLILDADGKFKLEHYSQAVESVKPKEKKQEKQNVKLNKPPVKKEPYRPATQGYSMKQERTMWHGLIDHLQSKQLLPVVAFVFSRAKCDQIAQSLMNVDLTTQKEKAHIHQFFEICVKSLKEPDRDIPQILEMRNILKNGIGVHHSGVLPIIKEMVEMLFQKGLVKVLFATETFAMGVNMPARTVVFDSITKHDGRETRNLLPAEYIQMAGRAGRRGLDETGTVMILCKGEVPKLMALQDMMLGKPSQLSSQFRLTYGMVLSLLRVESLSVEGMMSRSFREAHHQKQLESIREELKKVENKISQECTRELGEYMDSLVKFYDYANFYLQMRQQIWPKVIKSAKVAKELIPGRILLITHRSHVNKFALLLNVFAKPQDTTYKVLVLTNKNSNSIGDEKPKLWYKMLGISNSQIFFPDGIADHTVLLITADDILEITNKSIKVETDLVANDWENRQNPRFKDNPPGQTCTLAVQELLKLTKSTKELCNSDVKLIYLDLIRDLKINDLALCEEIKELNGKRDVLEDCISSTKIPNFEEQFYVVFSRKSLEDKRADLKFQLSHAGMSLYPEYERRIKLLQKLKYVGPQNRVELKGRVACEMGMNELLITELVLRNVLTKLQPAEVAALLSALVFQAKTRNEPQLTKELEKGKLEIEKVSNEITQLEAEHRIERYDFSNELNFGLVEVVYEWANAKPFADIMLLTDVQEGIIVRCIQQLNEILCDVRDAAKLIGDPELQNKMEEASTAIKRDIVFAASLYTQRESAVI